jgi:hypothetical protein
MELFTTHHHGTSTALPWKAKTIEEEEKQMRPVVKKIHQSITTATYNDCYMNRASYRSLLEGMVTQNA